MRKSNFFSKCVLFLFLAVEFLSSSSSQANDDVFEKFSKEVRANAVQIQKNIFEKKIPVYLTVDCEHKPTEDKIKSLVSKKLRELGDISIKTSPRESIASIHVVAVNLKGIDLVAMSGVICRNSKWVEIIFTGNITETLDYADEYLTSYVLTNGRNSFSDNINSLVATFDTSAIQPIRSLVESR